jgi:cytochrome c
MRQRNTYLIIMSVGALYLAGCGDKETSAQEAKAVDSNTEPAVDTIDNSASKPIETAVETIEDMPSESIEPVISAKVAEPKDFADEYASLIGDSAKGKRVFVKCMACHGVVEGQNKIGPSLYGIVGRSAGAIENFKYSAAMAGSDVVWSDEALFAYLKDPKAYLPGNKMIFPGIADAQQRADLIAFLKTTTQ